MRRSGLHQRIAAAGTLAGIAALLAACGSTSSKYASAPRAPVLFSISAAVTSSRVLVSPHRLGAGPVVFVIANESAATLRLTIARASGRGAPARSGPIGPAATASLPDELHTGRYVVSVDDAHIRAGTIIVGRASSGAQNQLLRP